MLLTGHGSNNGDKLVEIITCPDSDSSTKQQRQDSEKVLFPLDQVVVLARASEDAILHDTDSREKLQRD